MGERLCGLGGGLAIPEGTQDSEQRVDVCRPGSVAQTTGRMWWTHSRGLSSPVGPGARGHRLWAPEAGGMEWFLPTHLNIQIRKQDWAHTFRNVCPTNPTLPGSCLPPL